MRLHALLALLSLVLVATPALHGQEPGTDDGKRLTWSFETKLHYRDSEQLRLPILTFMFPPEFLPVGEDQGFLETVNEGQHLEISTATLFLDAALSDRIAAHLKVDFVDLYERNPTSGDKKVDVDEAWIRFGRETDPGFVPEGAGAYLKAGKMGRFERQDDRHLESYGLVSTAFNRFEDLGLEAGVDLGPRVYVKVSATQGNPLFMRDPNALAGDNGTDALRETNPDPELKSGITILYDAEVEDLDVDGDLELSVGLGTRIGPALGPWNLELLVFGSERDLADTVELEGTFYGGDLDLLRGPFDLFPFAFDGRSKEEIGANLWLYARGLTVFAQWVEQDIATLERSGFEVEVAYELELPLVWAVGGRQLFPYLAPAARFSRLEPEFGIPENGTPTPSWTWDWDKLDAGLRLGIVDRTDLTLDYSRNELTLASGSEVSYDELLTTLRWRF